MRVNFFSQSGTQNAGSQQGLSATMSGPLILAGNPTGPLEASPKQYVDSVVNSLNAANIKSGTLSTARLPAFTGDVTSATGSGTFVLANSGVVAGTYTKVTVDSKGRILAGSNLTVDDIPPFNWTKITSGKPTTIPGYGITDAMSKDGATITGTLSLNIDPTQPMHAANKQYVDGLGGGGAFLNTGIVVRRPTNTTPAGFLRCNGGQVSRTTYSALFAAIKVNYDVYTTVDYANYSAAGNGQPWRFQYDINVSQVNDITGWAFETNISGQPLSNGSAIVTKNRVYMLGGIDDSIDGSYSDRVMTAPIDANGNIGTWTQAGSLAISASNAQAFVTINRVYLIGGIYNNGSGGSHGAYVQSAVINTDGTLGPWVLKTSLPVTIVNSQVVVTKKRVYTIAGQVGGGISGACYTAVINDDGSLGPWSNAGINVPASLYLHQVAVTKNLVYVLGGNLGSGSSNNTIYYSTIGTDGSLSPWTIYAGSNVSGTYTNCYVTKNAVYLFNIDTSASVKYAPLDANGNLGSFVAGTQMVVSGAHSCLITTSSKIYLFGRRQSGSQASVVSSPINGTINDYSSFYGGTINKFDGSSPTSTFLYNSYDSSLTQAVGNGTPWRSQYDINTSQSSTIGPWATGPAAAVTIGQSSYVVTNKFLYTFGDNASYLGGCVPINTDGTLGNWTVYTTGMTENVTNAKTVVYKNKVYMVGGNTVVSSTATPTQKIWVATINSDGSLGSWTQSYNLPIASVRHEVVIIKNRMFVIGGNNTNSRQVIYANIAADGSLGAWQNASILPVVIQEHICNVIKNKVYIFGGYSGGVTSDVYSANIDSDGMIGAWSKVGTMPGVMCQGNSVVVKNRVYVLGASQTYSSGSNVIYSAPINTDGTLGTWTTDSTLSVAMRWSKVFVTSSRIYAVAGYGSSGTSSQISYAAFSGGLNDYSPYYNGTINGVDLTQFNLPDFTSLENAGQYYYIKY